MFSPVDERGPNRVRHGEGLPPGWAGPHLPAGLPAQSFAHCFSLATPGEVQLSSPPGEAHHPWEELRGWDPCGTLKVWSPLSDLGSRVGGVSTLARAAQTFHQEDFSALNGGGSGSLH